METLPWRTTLQIICGVLIAFLVQEASMSSDNQTNNFKTNTTYNIITSQNYFYNENEDNATKNSNKYSVVIPETEDNPIRVYKTEVNISLNNNDEFELASNLSSVFDLASYNNTCGRTPKQRACFIQQNLTAELEAELCSKYLNIVRLSYNFSCYENLPGDELVSASNDYVQKLTLFLQTHVPVRMREYYSRSMRDVHKMARVVEMADIQAAQGRKAYSLPHSPPYTFTLVPIEIPVLHEQHNIYILELSKYLYQTANLSNYMRENNLTNIFPYLYEILLGIENQTEAYLHEDLFTLAKLEILLQKYNEFNSGYAIFDLTVMGIAGIFFFVGIFLNVILLAVFVRYKETRTLANAMLMNLVVVDCISLVFNLLVYYVIDRFFYSQVSCTILAVLIVIRHISYIVSVYSVVIISFQRYRAVSQKFVSLRCKLSDKTETILMTCGVWVFAIIYSLPHAAFVEFSGEDCAYDERKYSKIVLNIRFCLICVLPLILVAIFSIMASFKLRQSIKLMPGERMVLKNRVHQRTVSSRILLGLVFLSTISYLPYQIVSYIYYYGTRTGTPGFSLSRTPGVHEYLAAITYNFLYISSCFNPLVLYFLSNKFRKLSHEIICMRKSNP